MPEKEHLRADRAAARLGVTPQTLIRWTDADYIKVGYRAPGPRGVRYYPTTEVERLASVKTKDVAPPKARP